MRLGKFNKKQLESHIDELQKVLVYLEKSHQEILSMKVILNLDKMSKNIQISQGFSTVEEDRSSNKTRQAAVEQLKNIRKDIKEVNELLGHARRLLNELYDRESLRA